MTTLADVTPMLIDGQRVPARSGDTIPALNPATGEVIGHIPAADAGDVDRAVQAAGRAFPSWRRTEPEERARALDALAGRIDAHAEELVGLDVADNGSPIREMAKDAKVAAAQLRYFAGLVFQIRGDTIPTSFDRLNYSIREPYGVVARIIPFNHPLMFAASKIAAPLAAGNTVVLKPSEHTSLSALRLAELTEDLLPPGVLNVVTGYGASAGDALVRHDGVRRLAFIGSAQTGRAIVATAAGVHLKRVSLELGGKNPLVIFPDADVELALDAAVRGMNFTWQGQSCGSTSRLLVHASRYDEFVERLAERIGSLVSGDPSDYATETGAIVSAPQLQKVLSYVELGVAEGARRVVGGERITEGVLAAGNFVRPALFADVDPGSRLAQEEIFGPVLAAMPFADYDDALRIANGVQYGLTASVFTQDLGLAMRFARDVEAGYVWVNDVSRHSPGTAFGGVKESGMGREEDIEELFSYTESKNVHVRFG